MSGVESSNVSRDRNGRFVSRFITSGIQNFSKFVDEKSLDEEKEFESGLGWREGRRIVDLWHLSKELEHCKNCSNPLYLHHCTGEKRYGLGILYIPCTKCAYTNLVSTCTRHRSLPENRGMQVWDINTKVSLGKNFLHPGQNVI